MVLSEQNCCTFSQDIGRKSHEWALTDAIFNSYLFLGIILSSFTILNVCVCFTTSNFATLPYYYPSISHAYIYMHSLCKLKLANMAACEPWIQVLPNTIKKVSLFYVWQIKNDLFLRQSTAIWPQPFYLYFHVHFK